MIPYIPSGWPTLAAAGGLVAAVVLLVAVAVWALWELLGPPSGAHAAGRPVGDDDQDQATNEPPLFGSMILDAERAGYDDDGGWTSGACDDWGYGGPPPAATASGPPWELEPGTFPPFDGMGGRGMPGPAPDPLAWLDRLIGDLMEAGPPDEPPGRRIQLPRTGRAYGGSIDAEGRWVDRWHQDGPDQPREYEVGGPDSPPPDLLWTGTIREAAPEVAHEEYNPIADASRKLGELARGEWYYGSEAELVAHLEREGWFDQPPVPPRPERADELAIQDQDAALYLARMRSACASWRASWTPAAGAA